MSWIQDNKFVAGLGAATVVLAGGLLYMGSAASDDYAVVTKKLQKAKSSVIRMKRQSPYPNHSAQSSTRTEVNAFTEQASTVQAKILSIVGKYNPAGESSPVFNEQLLKFRTELTQLFKDKGVGLPEAEGIYFGFDAYRSGGGIKADDKSRLVYQRNALYWLMTKLAEAQPARLVNVHRPLLKEEGGEIVEEQPKSRSRRSRSRRSAKTEVKPIDVVDNLPVEVSFVGNEDSLKAFLASIANEGMTKDGYPFSVRAMRVMSERQVSPVVELAEAAAPAEDRGATSLDDFSIEMIDAAPSAGATRPATGGSIEPIIEPIAGFDLLHVRILLDLQLFKQADEVKIPVQKSRNTTTSDAATAGEAR